MVNTTPKVVGFPKLARVIHVIHTLFWEWIMPTTLVVATASLFLVSIMLFLDILQLWHIGVLITSVIMFCKIVICTVTANFILGGCPLSIIEYSLREWDSNGCYCKAFQRHRFTVQRLSIGQIFVLSIVIALIGAYLVFGNYQIEKMIIQSVFSKLG